MKDKRYRATKTKLVKRSEVLWDGKLESEENEWRENTAFRHVYRDETGLLPYNPAAKYCPKVGKNKYKVGRSLR